MQEVYCNSRNDFHHRTVPLATSVPPLVNIAGPLETLVAPYGIATGPIATPAGALEIRNSLEIKHSLEMGNALEIEHALEVRQLLSVSPIFPFFGNTLLVIQPLRRKCGEKSVFAAFRLGVGLVLGNLDLHK